VTTGVPRVSCGRAEHRPITAFARFVRGSRKKSGGCYRRLVSKLPPALQYAFVSATIGALVLGCCGFYSGASVVMSQLSVSQLEGSSDGPLRELLAGQRIAQIGTGIAVVLDLCSAIALGLGGAIGLTGRPLGRTITLIAAGLVTLTGIAGLVVAIWITASMGDALTSIAPASGEEARMMRMISIAGMLPSACWLVMKLGGVAAITSVLFSAETRAFYERVGAEGLSPGSRG
jgi:hypothetical protein